MFKRLLPDQIVQTIYDIDLQALVDQGIRGMMTDLDNTLVGAGTALATPELVAWLARVKERGLQAVVLSNNNETRVSTFAKPLGIPYIPAARKPFGAAFRRGLELMQLRPDEVVIVGDQMLTDVLGGRRAGLHTILVTPIAPNEEGFGTRINRRIEKIALARLRKQGLWPDKGEH